MKGSKKVSEDLKPLKEKVSGTTGKAKIQSDSRTFNHPRGDQGVRTGKS